MKSTCGAGPPFLTMRAVPDRRSFEGDGDGFDAAGDSFEGDGDGFDAAGDSFEGDGDGFDAAGDSLDDGGDSLDAAGDNFDDGGDDGSFFLTMVSSQRRSDGSTPRAVSSAPRRLSAAASIWRTRSRVSPICLPMASRVCGSPPPSPKRWVMTRRS